MIFRRTSKCLSLMRSCLCSRLYLPASRSLATALVSPSGCLRPARVLVHARASPSTYIPLACNHTRVFFGLSGYFKIIVPLSDPADTCSFVFAYLRLLLPSCSRAIALVSPSGCLPPSLRSRSRLFVCRRSVRADPRACVSVSVGNACLSVCLRPARAQPRARVSVGQWGFQREFPCH